MSTDLRRRIAALEKKLLRPAQPAGLDQVVLYDPASGPPALPPRPDSLPWFFIPKNGREPAS